MMKDRSAGNIKAAALKIGDVLLQQAVSDNEGCYWPVEKRKDFCGRTWSNAAGIYNGNAGIGIFLLNLYLYTGDAKYLEAIEKNLRWQQKNCRSGPTGNYSFYTGRMGLVYLYLLLYRHTSEARYLDEGLTIARECTRSSFLHSSELTGAVFEGVAGTLQVFMALYEVAKPDWVLHFVESAAEKLLKMVYLSDKGAFWGPVRENTESFCGYAHGLSGIAVAFFTIGKYFNNPAFAELAEFALVQEDRLLANLAGRGNEVAGAHGPADEPACVDAEAGAGQTFRGWHPSLGYGIAGVALGRLYASAFTRTEECRHFCAAVARWGYLGLDDPAAPAGNNSMYEGRSGTGFFFLQMFRETGEDRYLGYAREMAHLVSGSLPPDHPPATNPDFMYGLSGVGFFLLQVLEPALDLGILAPLPGRRNGQAPHRVAEGSVLGKHAASLKELVHAKIFPHSILLLKAVAPQTLDNVMHLAYARLAPALVQHVESEIAQSGEFEDADLAAECRKEAARFRMRKPLWELSALLAREKQQHLLMVEIFTQSSVAPLYDKVWKVSDEVFITGKGQKADLRVVFDALSFVEFWSTYARDTCIMLLQGDGRIEEYLLNIYNLVIEQFTEGQTIHSVTGRVLDFLMCQPDEVRELLRHDTKSNDDDQLRELLKDAMTEIIYECIIDGILVPTPEWGVETAAEALCLSSSALAD